MEYLKGREWGLMILDGKSLIINNVMKCIEYVMQKYRLYQRTSLGEFYLVTC